MELFLSNPALLVVDVAILLSVFLLPRKPKGRPPSVPLLGHIHLLGGPVPPHLVLGKMTDSLGAIFTIRMGVHKASVVNFWEIAKECLTTNNKVIVARPRSVASEVMAYNYAMVGLSPYGTYWRNIRRIMMAGVLTNQRLALLKHVRESEVRASVRGVFNHWKENNRQPVKMTKVFRDIVLNIIFRMIMGKRYEDQKDDSVFFELMGSFLVSDALSFRGWMDFEGHKKVMRDRDTAREVQRWLNEHRRRRKLEGMRKSEDEDFMDIMISTIDGEREDQLTDYNADTVIKSTCMEVLKKAQQELGNEIVWDRHVKENDLKKLPYIQAIIKEILRLYPAGPLSVPHESMENCTTNGYHVKKGTRIIFNLTKIQRNAIVWEDPDVFRPERFLTTQKDYDLRGKNFEFIPFGGGRRIFPGISMSLQVLGLSLASFLHGFEFTTPGNEPADMTEARLLA